MSNRPLTVLFLISTVMVLLLGVWCVASRIEKTKERQALSLTKRRGREIGRAIRSYRADKGRFPEAGTELIPEYLSSIPQPVWGTSPWVYEVWKDVSGTEQATIFVYDNEKLRCWFLDVSGNEWQSNTGKLLDPMQGTKRPFVPSPTFAKPRTSFGATVPDNKSMNENPASFSEPATAGTTTWSREPLSVVSPPDCGNASVFCGKVSKGRGANGR